MVQNDLYLKKIETNNIVYSVDMLRLRTYITYAEFSEIEFRFKVAWSKYVKNFYTTNKISSFYYNYNIEIEDGKSFWFGFLHNNEKRSDYERTKYNFTIEFNPNKIRDNEILKYLLLISPDWFIVSYDLAFDLRLNILDIVYDQYLKRECDIRSLGMDNKSIKFGKGDGKTKIYNKKIESGLNIKYDLTRVEVSRVLEEFPINHISRYDYGDLLPKIYLNKYFYTFSDYKNKTFLAILYAVQSGFPLKDLSRTYRNKIKECLEGGCKIKFDKKSATQAVRQVILHYFINDPRVRWS